MSHFKQLQQSWEFLDRIILENTRFHAMLALALLKVVISATHGYMRGSIARYSYGVLNISSAV